MKIKDLRASTSHYFFADIKQGAVFIKGEMLYMTIEPIIDHGLGLVLNAVDLKTGELVCFSDDVCVQLVDAELRVK